MVPNKINTNRHIIIKMAKVKEWILKAAREKQRVIHKGIPMRLSADFSTKTLQVRREWQDIYLQSAEREKSATWDTLHSKIVII